MNEKTTPTQPLILASSSPRRMRLMKEAGFDFRVVAPPIGEPDRMAADVPPTHQAEALSYFKARSVATKLDAGVIIAADTIVACDGQIFGKPLDRDDARHILTALVGTRQEVITGVTVLDAKTGQRSIAHDKTIVVMRDLPEATIEEYLDTNEWHDKAGAYAIQDRADAFVERIQGSFTNVVGLPMEMLTAMLAEWGYQPTTPITNKAGK